MFGIVHCNASILARQNTDPDLFFVRTLVKNWLWPIVTFFGVTGNILAVIVLTKRRMIMSSTNNYLVALALVDIAYLVLTLLLNTLQHPCFMNTSLSEIVLTICRPIADFSSNTSVWLTVTFTVERWVAITYPLQSRTWCTVSRARRIILSVMGASLLCTLPSAFEVKLVRIMVSTNNSNETIRTSRIKAKPTALGNSLLYHQIYFNFVTFAIIWIPLVLLLIFNTILISYVRRSKQHIQSNNDGIRLRRHNRGNQGEQRKTTIMLIAVVIVFTVCQIPQAISLTVQSIFPVVARTSKVLIYNNFANCLVAVNASINFVLYCCFSERFRSTFRSNFSFMSKYCAQYIQSDGNRKSNPDQYTFTNSVDDFSAVNCSPYGNPAHSRYSTLSTDTSSKYNNRISTLQTYSTEKSRRFWFWPISTHSSKTKSRISYSIPPSDTRYSSQTKSLSFSPTMTSLKNPSHVIRQTRTFNVSPDVDQTSRLLLAKTISEQPSSTDEHPPLSSKHSSVPFYDSDRPGSTSDSHTKCHSYGTSTDNDPNNEQIWVKQGEPECDFGRRPSFSRKEIVDITV